MSAQGSAISILVNAAPCRKLAWGKSLLNVKSCVSPTGPDHSKNRETVFSDHCHQTGPVSGGRRDRNVCQTSKCPECGTHLPVGSRLTPFRDLGSLGGWTLGSTNVEGGLHSPFQSRASLTRSPKLSDAMHIFTGTYIDYKHYIILWTRNGAVEPVQNLWAS